MQLTEEQIRRAAACRTAEEFLAFAEAEGLEADRDKVEAYYAARENKELNEEELTEITGGKDLIERVLALLGIRKKPYAIITVGDETQELDIPQ